MLLLLRQIKVLLEQRHRVQEPWTYQGPDTMTLLLLVMWVQKKMELGQPGPRKSLKEPSLGEDTFLASLGPISV